MRTIAGQRVPERRDWEPKLREERQTLEEKSGPLRVLVIEDNRDGADSLRILLSLYGYDVHVALSGPAGVAEARRFRPHVVLCDIGLPELDGYGVVRELRRHPETAAAFVVAVSGYGTDEARRLSHEAGFNQHWTKPADPSTLLALLDDYTHRIRKP